MKQHHLPLAAVLLFASSALSQRPPDLKQLLPDEYNFYVSADGERVRASNLWSALTRTLLVGKLIQTLPVKFGIDPDDVDRVVVGIADQDRDAQQRVSVVFDGKHVLRASAFVDANARNAEANLTEETIGGRKVWVPAEGRGPGTADLGPGTLWLASPAVLRERLAVTERPRPAKPSAALEALLAKEAGAVFVALDGTNGAFELLQDLAVAGGLQPFLAACARIELTPVFEVDVTLVPDPRDDTAKVKALLEEKVAQGAEELKALGLHIIAKQCARIAIEVRGRDIGCVIKLPKGQEAALLAGSLWLFGTRSVELRVVEAVELEVEAVAPPVSRPASQPATQK